MITESPLHARIIAQNQCNEVANRLHEKLSEAMKPFVGQKVQTAPGDLIKKVAEIANATIKSIVPEMTPSITVFYRKNDYVLRWIIKTSLCHNNIAYYAENNVSIGRTHGNILVELIDPHCYKTDFTLEQILNLRKELQDAKNTISKIQNGLYHFGEYD